MCEPACSRSRFVSSSRCRGSQSSSTVTVKTAYNAKLKATILVNGEGMTLYAFTDDVGGRATCYDATYHC